MNREKELVKNTVVLALGRFLPKIVSLVTLPIVTAKLSKAEYGNYDLILTLSMLLLPIATLQIQSAAFRYLIQWRNDKKESSKIITNIISVTITVTLLVALIFVIFMSNLDIILRLAIVAYFFGDIMFNTVSQIARGLGRNRIYSISAILLSVVNGIGVVSLVQILQLRLVGVLVSLALANIAAIIYMSCELKIWQYMDYALLDKGKVLTMVKYSWPMIPNNLSTWVLKLSDRLVIRYFIGAQANAEYAVANKIPNLLSIAQSVFVMAWQENAAVAVDDKDVETYYTNMFDKIFSLMVGLTGLLIAGTPLMFMVLIRGDYDNAYIQMPILILGMFFYCMSAFQGGIYIAHMETKSVGMTTVVAAIVNLVIDLLLVNVIGITAGSLSSLVAYLVLYLYRMHDVKRIQPIRYNIKKQIILILSMIIMLYICSLRTLYTDIINAVIAIILFAVVNRKLIVEFFSKLKNKVK